MQAPRSLLSLALFGLISACGGSSATSTPPIYAPATADAHDAEAAPQHRLPEDTHPLKYAVTLEVVPSKPAYRGQVGIDIALDRPRETLYLHGKDLRPSAVRVVRVGADAMLGRYEQVSPSGMVAVHLPQPVGPGVVRLEIDFDANLGQHLSGLYHAQVGDGHYAFTQFEAISAREAFPCFDEPRFKTPFEITLRVPENETAIANTREVSAQKVAGGLRDVHFATTEKLPTYLIAFAVGPLDVVSAPDMPATALRKRALPLRGVAVKGRGKDIAMALRETPKIVEALENYFGMGFPYDKLDLIAVPDFGAGAMENAGAITFRDSLLLMDDSAPEEMKRAFSSVNAHELAHMWFGDLVTMPWWDDIWLNEAFATWMAEKVIGTVHPEWEPELNQVGSTHYAMDVDSEASARQIRQPIVSDHDIGNAFDAITYSKGGAVLSMFERYLGKDTFQAGLRLYMQKHAFGNASTRDLTAALGEAAKNPAVSDAFFTFLDQPGVPVVKVELDCAGDNKALLLSQSRYVPLASRAKKEASWQIPVCAKLGQASGAAQDVCTLLSSQETRFPITGACPTYVMPNAAAAGYYRWSLGSDALRALTAARDTLGPVEQMSLVANVLAAMRAGQLDADRALEVALALVPSQKRQVSESAAKVLTYVSDDLLDEDARKLYRTHLASVMRPVYDKFGLFEKGKSDGEAKLMREHLAYLMAFAARDPAVREELAKLGEALLGLGKDARVAELPSELLQPALAAAVQVRGASALDKATEKLFASQDGQERQRLLSAVASQRDPGQTEHVLALSLDERLRSNERVLPLFVQSSYPETKQAAYAWLKAHFDEMREKLGTFGASALLVTPGHLCSEEEARDVESNFSKRANEVLGGPRRLELTLESIRLCAAMHSAEAEKARAYFRALPVSVPTAPKGVKAPKKTAKPATH